MHNRKSLFLSELTELFHKSLLPKNRGGKKEMREHAEAKKKWKNPEGSGTFWNDLEYAEAVERNGRIRKVLEHSRRL